MWGDMMAKYRFRSVLAQVFEVPQDAAANIPRIEVIGTREALITGEATLLEYSPDVIRVASGGYSAAFRGDNLYIPAMDQMGMRIFGRIAAVEFE